MKHSQNNLNVIENFILFLTHCSKPEDGPDINFNTPMTFTPKIIYQAAKNYIEEDHVDGEDNEEDHIVTFGAESSFQTEDKDKEFPEDVVVVADFGDEIGTQTAARIEGTDIDGVNALIDFMNYPYQNMM